jgi:GNAT superfamily N-acetyltransferase
MLTIRPATPDDVPALVWLARRFLKSSQYGALLPNTTDDGLAVAVNLTLQHGVILLAEAGGCAVGMIAATTVPHPLTGAVYADEVAWFVTPEHRSGTVGLRLLDALERWCLTHQITTLRLVTPIDRPRLGAHLARRGYRAIETAYLREWPNGVEPRREGVEVHR